MADWPLGRQQGVRQRYWGICLGIAKDLRSQKMCLLVVTRLNDVAFHHTETKLVRKSFH